MKTYKLKHISGNVVSATPIWGFKRGWKSNPLDVLVTDTGHRITPYSLGRLWNWVSTQEQLNYCLESVYGRDPKLMLNLIYKENPLLKMILKNDTFTGWYVPVPILYDKP